MKKGINVFVYTILMILYISTTSAQPNTYSLFSMGVKGFGPADSTVVYFGNHPSATYGVDSLFSWLQEACGPPWGPGFNVRWVSVPGRPFRCSFGMPIIDLRGIPQNAAKNDTFVIKFFDDVNSGATWTFRWPNAAFLSARCDSMFLVDTTGNIPKTNMLTTDNLVINAPGVLGVTNLFIFKYGVKLADTVTGISGTVFVDSNGNGIRDNIGLPGEESALSGWQVNITGPENRTAMSDGTGRFGFYDLPYGSYVVSEVLKNGWLQTSPTPILPGNYNVTISSTAKHSGNNDFGNILPDTIRGMKFFDTNRNGVRDSGEVGLSNWRIRLRKSSVQVDSVLTNESGNYIFRISQPGVYTVSEQNQNGWSQTMPALPGIYTIDLHGGGNVGGKNFGNYQLCTISGIKFNDLNGNRIKDPGDTTLPGWKLFLKNSQNTLLGTALTDQTGNYQFNSLFPGTYLVSEESDTAWIQTYPAGLGIYTVIVTTGGTISGKDFGNTYAHRYTGGSSGNWSDSANWAGGAVPGANNSATIPPNVVVTVDSLSVNSVQAIRVQQGSTLQFSPTVGQLQVLQTILIDSGATIVMPDGSDSTGITCYGDWIMNGTFVPGNSTITFAGSDTQTIGSTSNPSIEVVTHNQSVTNDERNRFNSNVTSSIKNNFYNLKISSKMVNVIGNLLIQNQLFLHTYLNPGEKDSIIIANDDPNTIQDTGKIIRGTIKRKIRAGETRTYRFESPGSYVKFSATGTNPFAVSMTVLPNDLFQYFLWEQVDGTIDTVNNTITVNSVKNFSRWPFGIPRPTSNRKTFSNQLNPIDPVDRLYSIRSEGGDNFTAQLQLRYNQAEIPPLVSESDMVLFRGPYFADSVQGQWNMISLPLIPNLTQKDSLFPTSTSSAFAYDGTYMERTDLHFGDGYWLRFPSTQQVIIMGDDRDNIAIPVKEGWNMIGSISYPIAATSVASDPPGMITSDFFGYTTSYQIADSLKPMHSYWVKTNDAGSLILTFSTSGSLSKGLSSRNSLEELNTLTISDSKLNEGKLYFGSGGKVDVNRHVLPPVPPEGMYDVRFTNGKMVAVAGDTKGNDIPIQINSAEYPVTIRWEIKDAAQPASLIVDGQAIRLDKTGTIEISNPKSEIKLRLASSSSKELPKEFALQQNYPNPFNPTTTIKYQLPVDSRVTLRIYNILGQEVKTLIDEIQDAGYKSVELNVGNLSSGVYFYRLTTESEIKSFVAVKKLLLMK